MPSGEVPPQAYPKKANPNINNNNSGYNDHNKNNNVNDIYDSDDVVHYNHEGNPLEETWRTYTSRLNSTNISGHTIGIAYRKSAANPHPHKPLAMSHRHVYDEGETLY